MAPTRDHRDHSVGIIGSIGMDHKGHRDHPLVLQRPSMTLLSRPSKALRGLQRLRFFERPAKGFWLIMEGLYRPCKVSWLT